MRRRRTPGMASGHTSLSFLLAGALVATAALTDAILRSEAWIPLYARSLMPDSQWNFDEDTIKTPPLYEVRDDRLVMPRRPQPGADSMVTWAARPPANG